MESLRMEVFLSCSFEACDNNNMVNFVSSMCKGLNIHCVNVDRAFSTIPSDMAKDMISKADAIIAIASTRSETNTGSKLMSSSVRDEISMAYAMEKQILLLAEDGVLLDGFMKQYCTYMTFTKSSFTDFKFLEKLIFSIHNLKLNSKAMDIILTNHGAMQNAYAEFMNMLQSLDIDKGNYVWNVGVVRKLIFTGTWTAPIKGGCWSPHRPNNSEVQKDIDWNITIEEASRDFKFDTVVESIGPEGVHLSSKLVPCPQKGDHITYSALFKSTFINPIYKEDVTNQEPEITLQGRRYYCCDGLIPILRIQKAKIQFRFPSEYWRQVGAYEAIVGSHSARVDYVVDSEIKRMHMNEDRFGISTVVSCEIDSPMLDHIYGIAWNPPSRE